MKKEKSNASEILAGLTGVLGVLLAFITLLFSHCSLSKSTEAQMFYQLIPELTSNDIRRVDLGLAILREEVSDKNKVERFVEIIKKSQVNKVTQEYGKAVRNSIINEESFRPVTDSTSLNRYIHSNYINEDLGTAVEDRITELKQKSYVTMQDAIKTSNDSLYKTNMNTALGLIKTGKCFDAYIILRELNNKYPKSGAVLEGIGSASTCIEPHMLKETVLLKLKDQLEEQRKNDKR